MGIDGFFTRLVLDMELRAETFVRSSRKADGCCTVRPGTSTAVWLGLSGDGFPDEGASDGNGLWSVLTVRASVRGLIELIACSWPVMMFKMSEESLPFPRVCGVSAINGAGPGDGIRPFLESATCDATTLVEVIPISR